ncbi:MAG: hypothetical protein N3G20_09845 [Verrucomicrobiae bacterium]|nr:hypothetical protein [Verrucomicrobiae bacterium]
MLEAQTRTGLVECNGVPATPVDAVVERSNPSQLTGPACVIIPDGANSGEFSVVAFDDSAIAMRARFTVKVLTAGFVSD